MAKKNTISKGYQILDELQASTQKKEQLAKNGSSGNQAWQILRNLERDSYEKSSGARKSADSWVKKYDTLLDDVSKSGATRQNVELFNSLRSEYDQISSVFNQSARKSIADSFHSVKSFFDSRAGKLPSNGYYQEHQDTESLKSTVKEFEKKLSALQSQMEEYDKNPNVGQIVRDRLQMEIDSVTSELDSAKKAYDAEAFAERRYKDSNVRSGKFEYDPKYDSSIPFRGRGGGGLEAPEKSSFSDYTTNRTAREMSEKGWSQFQEDDAAKEADRQAAREWLSKPHIGVDPMTKAVMGMTIDDSYKLPSDQWTQEERDVFGLLYETDKDKAEQFAIDTNNSYKQKEQNRQLGEVKQFADEHPIAATTIGNTAQALGIGMADFMTSGIEKMARGTITQRGFVSPSQASEAATGRVAENLNDEFGTIKEGVPVFGGRGLGDVYQLLNSVVVSAATANTTGPLGTDIVFFGNAAASAMDDAKNRGATDEQALTMALISGTAEAAGEHFSASHLLEMTDAKTIKAFFGSLFGQAFEEGEEEFFTSFVNNLADNYVMQDKSDFNQYVDGYKQNNPEATDEEAKKAAWKQMWSDMAFDAVGGFASGGIHTVAQIGGIKVLNSYSDHQVKSTFGRYQNEILQNAEQTSPGSDVVQKAREAIEDGEDLTGAQLRELLVLSENGAGEAVSETGFSVRTDSERGSTVISFDEVPPKSVQEALKSSGFNYSSKNKVWFGQKSQEEARRIVLEAGEELYQKQEVSSSVSSGAMEGSVENSANGEGGAEKKQKAISKPFYASEEPGTTLLNMQDGSTVETKIINIASNEPGKLMLNVAGQDSPVRASDISYADIGEASLYYYVNDMELTPDAANMIVERVKSAVSGMDGTARAEKMAQFSRSIYGMYSLGKNGIPQGKAMSSEFAGQLSGSMAEVGYQLGRRIYLQNVQQKEATKQQRAASQRAIAATGGKKINGVQYDGLSVRTGKDGSVEIDGVVLNEQQKAGIRAAELLSSIGVNVHVFQSKTGADGKPVGENGSYSMKDGSIHIELNAGNDGQGVMAYTIAHELTHFMEDQQPEQFSIFTDALFEDLDTEVEAEIARKAEELKRQLPEQYKDAGNDKLMEDARSEVVAEACETMLTDTDAARQIAQRIQAQDASLWEKIVQWFKDFGHKLRDAYNGLKPDSGIAKEAKKTLQQVDGLVKMWSDMAVDSAENYRSALSDMEMSNDVEDGVKKSIRNTSKMTWEEQLRENRKGNLRSSDSFYIGETPTVYGDSFSEHPLVMNQSDYKKSSTIKHNVPNRVFKRLPSLLENPIMTFTQDGRTVAVLDDIDADGKPLVAALHALEQMDREAVTAVTSVYGVDNWTSWLANQSKKEIRIHNKTRANSILQTYGSNASVEEAIRSMEESHTTATTDKPISDINRGSSGSMVAQDGDSVKRSYRKAETEESHKKELADTKSRLNKEAEEKREKLLRDYQKNRNISVENWKMTELTVLKTAAENVSSLDLTEREKNGIAYFSRHLQKLEAIQGEIDTIKNQEGELSQNDLKKITALEKQADSVRKLIWEYSEYDVLKKVSEKTRKLLMEKYGSIKPGENPARQADIPKRTNDQNRVSQTVRTAIEASATTDEMAEKLRQKAIEGEFSYLPITDDASSKRAVASIERKGWVDSLIDWKVAMRKTDFQGKDLVTLGLHLYNNAVNSGKTKEALDILTDITNTVRNSAQVVQAVRILKKLSPENRLYAIQRQIGALQDDLVKRYGDKAPQIDMNSALVKNYMDAQGEENIRAAEKALFRDIAAQLPNTFADKWNSWRYLSMLGNVRTHVRNVVGNVGFVPVRATKDLIAAGMEAAVDKLSKNGIDRTKSVLNPLNEADRALYTAGMNDYAAAEELLDKANLKSGDSISRIEQYKPAFGGDKAIWRALSKVAEANSNALSFEDMLFKKTTYASAFAGYMKANKVTSEMLQKGEVAEDFLDKARVYAFEEALKATYNDFNDFSNFVAKLGRLRNSRNPFAKAAGFLAEGALPFKRTPSNILARAVEYSTLGPVVYGINAVRKGEATAAEAIDAIASGLTGTALSGLGVLLASMGLVSGGGDDDDKQEAFDKLRGDQSYALNVFGKSYTIDWLAPEIIPLFMGVEFYNRISADGAFDLNDIYESMVSISKPLLEMSMLQGLNDILDAISYSDNKLYAIVSQAATNHVLQALPTLFGQIERVGETEREQTYIDKNSQIPKDLQYTIAKAANKIPGVEFEQIPYIDAYGRRQETGNIGTRMFSNLVSPGYLSSDRSAPWDDELERLYKLGFETVYPKRPTTKINQKELTAEEYVDHATFTGQERYRLLGLVLSSDYYKSKNDAEKAEIIADVYSYVAAEGKYRYDKDSTIPKWTETAMELEKKGGSFIDVLKDREADRSKNGNLSKEQCVEYIQKNFPESQWEEVWNTMKLKTWTNKDTPWE